MTEQDSRGITVWITGLPAAGKTTLGQAVAAQLQADGGRTYRLDGDELRCGLCADLGFDAISRHENVRRTAYVARMLAESGLVVIASLISPFTTDRARAREIHREAGLDFLEVYLDTPLLECERRDPRGLYSRARRGNLRGLTGIDAPYEVPLDPDLTVHPGPQSVPECVELVVAELRRRTLKCESKVPLGRENRK